MVELVGVLADGVALPRVDHELTETSKGRPRGSARRRRGQGRGRAKLVLARGPPRRTGARTAPAPDASRPKPNFESYVNLGYSRFYFALARGNDEQSSTDLGAGFG